MREIQTEDDFPVEPGVVIVITDIANGNTVHVVPCSYVKLAYFHAKVIAGRNKNGRYVLCDSIEDAESELAARRCGCAGHGNPGRHSPRGTQTEARGETAGAGPGYRVGVMPGPNRVIEACSSDRLNLEPTRADPRHRMRQELLQALRGASAVPGMFLHAVYESAIDGPFDTENILFCNVRSILRGLRAPREGRAAIRALIRRPSWPRPAVPSSDDLHARAAFSQVRPLAADGAIRRLGSASVSGSEHRFACRAVVVAVPHLALLYRRHGVGNRALRDQARASRAGG